MEGTCSTKRSCNGEISQCFVTIKDDLGFLLISYHA